MKDKFSALGKYNFWKGNVPELGFKRLDYTNKIFDYVGNKLIKVLVGQRRAGKSYILRQIAQRLINEGVNPQNIFYINKEFTDFDFIENYKDLDELLKYYREALKPSGKIYLFVDEIQNVEGWEHFANSHSQDFVDVCEIFISGSNSKMLSGELATLLSGRYVNFEILPFSYNEYLGITNKENIKQSYIDYMESGLTSDYKKAISEYIWNGFDAKATQVDIDFTNNEIGHLFSLSIMDNGTGIRLDNIDDTFGSFLDSQKKDTFNKDGFVKGKMGKGRYSFSLFANKAIWQTRYKDEDKILQYNIEILKATRNTFNTYNKTIFKESNSTGTKVIFEDINSLTSDLLDSDQFENYLCGEFGWFLFLNKNKDYCIRINGKEIDYFAIIEDFDELEWVIGDSNFSVKFLRWNEKIGDKFYYYFLNTERKENHRKHTSFNNSTNGFHHSVYIESELFNDFTLTKDDNPVLGLSSANQSSPDYKKLINQLHKYVFGKEKQFIRESQAESLIDKYRNKQIFPPIGNNVYAQYRQQDLETVVKEIYCIQPKIFQGLKDTQSRTLVGFLNLLLDTEQRENVLTIIENVIQLSEEERILLSKSLQKTSFSQITRLINLLEYRHNVVSSLKSLVFDHEKFTNERNHIQKIIENNYWLFGEQYHLVSADKNFEIALNNYLYYVEGGNKKPQKIEDKEKLMRPDIFTCKQNSIPDANNSEYLIEENIIVELKRPSVIIGKDQYSQIEDYLIFIMKEPRFNSQLRKWKFILIGKEVDSFIINKYESQRIKGKRFLIEEMKNSEIYAMTWDDVFKIFESRHDHLINKLEFKNSVLEELEEKGVLFTKDAPGEIIEVVTRSASNM